MSNSVPQNYENHRRYIFGYHVLTFFLLTVNLVWALYLFLIHFTVASVISVATSVAILLVAYYAREFALGDQDRIIRLEERLRLGNLLPDDLKPQISSLTTRQLVALRFASDAELPDLTRTVITEGLTDGKEIKRRIKAWKPDHQRI